MKLTADNPLVFHTDALSLLSKLGDSVVDAVVTDPPFGLGKSYVSTREVATNPRDYWEWFAPIYQEMLRVLKPGGFLAVWQAQPYMRYLWRWFGDDIHIYVCAKNFVQLRKKTPINYAYDPVVIGYKHGAKPLRPPKPKRNLDYFVANTAALVSKPDNLERQHPHPKPLDVVREIVKNFTRPGGVVVDPFVGSGSTLIACMLEGRRAFGCDIEKEYVELARQRIEAAKGG